MLGIHSEQNRCSSCPCEAVGLVDVADAESDEHFHRSMGCHGMEAEAAVSAKVEESRD